MEPMTKIDQALRVHAPGRGKDGRKDKYCQNKKSVQTRL